MERRTLEYFLAVARDGNITRAAEKLHISQPALSRQIRQLENELGVCLFVRGQHSVSLTDAGAMLRLRAEEILELTEKAESEIRNGGEYPCGTVSIGSGEAATTAFLADCMRSFSEKYPEVKFELYSGDADSVKERLERGLLDIGVLIETAPPDRFDSLVLPQKERWGALVSASGPLARLDAVSPSDFAGQKVFLPKRAATQGVVKWFGDLYDGLDVSVTFNLLYNAAVLVVAGMGNALTIEGAAELYKNPDVVFKPFSPEHTVSSIMVWKKHHAQSPAVNMFVNHVKCVLGIPGNEK